MRLEDVLPALRKGCSIRRKDWPKEKYLFSPSYWVKLDAADVTAIDWVIEEPPTELMARIKFLQARELESKKVWADLKGKDKQQWFDLAIALEKEGSK